MSFKRAIDDIREQSAAERATEPSGSSHQTLSQQETAAEYVYTEKYILEKFVKPENLQITEDLSLQRVFGVILTFMPSKAASARFPDVSEWEMEEFVKSQARKCGLPVSDITSVTYTPPKGVKYDKVASRFWFTCFQAK